VAGCKFIYVNILLLYSLLLLLSSVRRCFDLPFCSRSKYISLAMYQQQEVSSSFSSCGRPCC
jgi:hypothetical protein